MGKRFRLRDLEREHGDLHKVIPPLVARYGQGGAACRLGVSPATISLWLKANGYVLQTSYVRKPQPKKEHAL